MKKICKRLCAVALTAIIMFSGSIGTWNNWGAKEVKAATFNTLLSAQDIVTALGNGWNLGDTLDCYDSSGNGSTITATSWGNAAPTQATFNAVAAYGFDSVRIPVSWSAHLTEESLGSNKPDIENSWLAEVKSVVDMAINAGLYVVVNIHHPYEKYKTNETWGDPTASNVETAKSYGSTMWTEIATYFKDYDHHLVFETVNEIRDRSNDDWTGNDTMYNNVNEINASCLNAIRATGGNNAERLVLLPTYAHGTGYQQVDAWEAPTSLACGEEVGRIGMAVHAYEPRSFAFTERGTDTFTDTVSIDTLMTRMKNKGVPFVFTEWGSLNKGNTLERSKHANYYVRACLSAGGSLMWWDNSIFVTSGYKTETFGLIARLASGNNSLSTPFPMIVGAMKNSSIGFSSVYVDESTAGGLDSAGGTISIVADADTGVNYLKIAAESWGAPRVLSASTLDWSSLRNSGFLKFAYKIPSGGITSLTVRLHDDQGNYSYGIQKVEVTGLMADGEWHECKIPLSEFTTWGGTTSNKNATGIFDFSKVKGVGFEISGGSMDVNQIRTEYVDTSRKISVWENGNVPSGFSLESKTASTVTDASGNKYISCKSVTTTGMPWFVRVVADGNNRLDLSTAYEKNAKLTVTLCVADGTSPVNVDFCIGDDAYTTSWVYHTVNAVSSLSSSDWQTYEIELSEFTDISDWSKISAIGLRYNTVGSAYGTDDTLYAKDIKVVWEEEEEVVYNVDITWGDMQFDYATDTSTWSVAAGKTNTIGLANNSGFDVKASFEFTADSAYTSLGPGGFKSNNETVTSVTVADTASKTVNFMPSGSISADVTEYTKIGDITVTIGATTEHPEQDKLLCLTFDDGPSTTTMDAVLDVLAEYDAKATFFVVGNKIEANTDVLQRAVNEGHEIGNHSWSHQSMGDLWNSTTSSSVTNANFDTAEEILPEITQTQEKVQEVAGVTPLYFRPPNLSNSTLLQETVKMPFVTMSTDTTDYAATATAQSVYEAVVAGAKDGAIILQHCYEGNTKTVEALRLILPWCEENGYKLVTVSEMFAAKNITPENGKYYRSSTQVHQSGPYTQ